MKPISSDFPNPKPTFRFLSGEIWKSDSIQHNRKDRLVSSDQFDSVMICKVKRLLTLLVPVQKHTPVMRASLNKRS